MKKIIIFTMTLCLLLFTMMPAMATEASLVLSAKLTRTEVAPGASIGYTVSASMNSAPSAYQEVRILVKDAANHYVYLAQPMTNDKGIVTGTFKLPPKATGGQYKFIVTTTDANDQDVVKSIDFKVKGSASNPNLKTDKLTYYLGETVQVSGLASGEASMIANTDVTLTLYKKDTLIFVNQLQTDEEGKFNFEWSVGKRKSLKGDYTFVIACAGTEMKSSFKVIPDNKSLSVDDVLYQLQQKGYMSSTVNEKQLLSQTLFLEVLCKMSNVTVAEGQSPLVALEKAGILKNIKFAQTGKMSIEEMNACWASFYANSKKVTLADPIFSFDRTIRTVSAVYYEAEDALMYYYDDDIETEDDANVTDFIVVLYRLFMQ